MLLRPSTDFSHAAPLYAKAREITDPHLFIGISKYFRVSQYRRDGYLLLKITLFDNNRNIDNNDEHVATVAPFMGNDPSMAADRS